MDRRNLLYKGVTRDRRLVVIVGQWRAVGSGFEVVGRSDAGEVQIMARL